MTKTDCLIAGMLTTALAAGMLANAKAEVVRSHRAIAAFKKEHPCPANSATKGPCPGYVIDHVIPLACKGPDDPANMQWQTEAAGKWKDSWERRDCSIWYRMPTNWGQGA